ncbi:MAG: alpha/beta hydrolase [Pseudomonadota bacterium]
MSAQPDFHANLMTFGTGARRILALHCTMAFGGAWAALAKHLGPNVAIVAPDMPSHGRSVDWDEHSDFGETAYQSAVASLDPDPMDVVGHSFGAVIALRMALRHPQRVRSLTLIEPVFFAVALHDAPHVMDDHDARARPFTEAIARGDKMEAARAFNRMWGDTGADWEMLPESTRAAMARAIHVVPDTYGLLYDDTSGMLTPGTLEACQMPCLIMRGENAHPAVVVTNDGLAKRIVGARQAVIAKAGHMAPISHPASVAAELTAFFASGAPV